MKVVFLLLVAALVQFVAGQTSHDAARERALKLISQMTLDEKISMVHGSNGASDPGIAAYRCLLHITSDAYLCLLS